MNVDNMTDIENPELLQDISPDKNGGILKTILKHGDREEGNPHAGCKVYVHYVGILQDGEKFDSSRDRDEVFHFELGKNSVIKGWDIGVATMHKNETCELKIAPQYGYGEEGFPPKIPENATLIFQIELLGWDEENVTEDKRVRKRILKEGDSLNRPNKGALVKVHLRGSYDGRLFDERDIEFFIGQGYQHDIVDGIEEAICKMKRHEKARVFIHSDYAFGENGNDKFDIPPCANDIIYEICLFNFEKAKELYEMTFNERIENSQLLKERALMCIKSFEYKKAISYYDRIIQLVRVHKEDSDYPEGLPFKIAANLNSALCYLKLNDFQDAKKKCEQVLKYDTNNVKAYFRLGEALVGLREYRDAIESYENALKIEPANTAAKKQCDCAKLLLKKQVDKEKKLYGNIFAKMGEN